MFLGLMDGLNRAIDQIKALVNDGLGPVMLLSNTSENTMTAWEFGIDFGVQIISTILLFLAVRFLLWKPVTKLLEARKAAIDKELDDAKAAKELAIEDQRETDRILSEAKSKVKAMLDEATKESNIRREQIIEDAQNDAQRIVKNAEDEADQVKKSVEGDLKKEIIEVAFLAAEKIVGKEIDQSKYLDVVDDIIKGDN